MRSTPHIKPLTPEAGSPPDVVAPSRRHGHGAKRLIISDLWGVFAALMIALVGVFNVIAGLAALADARFFYVAGAGYVWTYLARAMLYVWSDFRTWGWIVLAQGVVQLVAAGAIRSGRAWGRWFGISVASLNALGQMVFIPAYPLWSLLIIAVDILVIYGLATLLRQR